MIKLLALVVALMLVRWIHVSPQNPVMSFKVNSWLPQYWSLWRKHFPKIEPYWHTTYMFWIVWIVPALLLALLYVLASFVWMGLLAVLLAGLVLWACFPDFSDLLPQHRDVKSLVLMAHEHLFAVVFWFVLLGPAGALLYHSLSVYQQYTKRYHSELLGWETAIHWTHFAMGWIPARLTALFFGLVGNFETGFHAWRKMALDPHVDSESLVITCAEASLKDQGSNEQDPSMLAFTLVERASFIWLIVLAVISFNI